VLCTRTRKIILKKFSAHSLMSRDIYSGTSGVESVVSVEEKNLKKCILVSCICSAHVTALSRGCIFRNSCRVRWRREPEEINF
jgi:hypothetical protein